MPSTGATITRKLEAMAQALHLLLTSQLQLCKKCNKRLRDAQRNLYAQAVKWCRAAQMAGTCQSACGLECVLQTCGDVSPLTSCLGLHEGLQVIVGVVETRQLSDKQGIAARHKWLQTHAPGNSTVMVEGMGTRVTVMGSVGKPWYLRTFLAFFFLFLSVPSITPSVQSTDVLPPC